MSLTVEKLEKGCERLYGISEHYALMCCISVKHGVISTAKRESRIALAAQNGAFKVFQRVGKMRFEESKACQTKST